MQALIYNTNITVNENGEPRASINEGTSFTTLMNHFKELQHNLTSEEVYAWILGQSLFDPQPTPANMEEMHDLARESYESLGRRTRCSNWLSYVTKSSLEADLRRIEAEGGPLAQQEAIFVLLAGNKRQKASVAAVQSRNLRLATLIAQSGRGAQPLLRLENQMKIYQEADQGRGVSSSYMKAYALLSGALDINIAPKDEPQSFVTDGLDWRRAFGLYLWHSNTPGADLGQALSHYSASMSQRKSVARPTPWYQRNTDSEPEHFDFLFQLIALLTHPSKALEDVLHPLGMGPVCLDYRQSWLFYMVLCQSLHASQFRSELSHAQICQSFIFQLENLGLWEWAVFVALHLETASSRELVIRQILERHVDLPTLSCSPSSSISAPSKGMATLVPSVDTERWEFEGEKNSFLLKDLRIPEAWLWSARAVRAKYNGELYMEVFSLLKAGEYERGHKLILSSLAPVSILQGDLSTLNRVLGMINQNKVQGWANGGAIYQEYLKCCSDFEGRDGYLLMRGNKVSYANDLVPQKDTQILQSEVQALLKKLPLLLAHQSTDSPSLQVCVSEMASRCTTLLRDLKELVCILLSYP
ncbi:nuclear protein 96-domain-containing protein [Lobosporangium transversale]|uniref:Nuclear protein 96-domain-containing protein n=1 Tax=Lobosporangium transversale TaxID=64571 RepID=A0A1Y2GUL4_9FUNG|nr:nuclear protein 96-domain-containing protein [Lobosporangium transversale]ORZ21044.1 nuclear protein 96-domain-containing protein [Lobosporangium transversale]|eukprot:XP_021882953.1 nuclear protein 96-domain-containing protein [Lobosporangium transversale]